MRLQARLFHQICQFGGWILILVQLAMLLWQWTALPSRIPAHYNAAGEINRWGSKFELLLLPGLSILMLTGLNWVSRRPQLWNIPAEITAENQEALEAVTLKILSILEALVIFWFALLETFMISGRSLPIALTLGLVFFMFALVIIAILWLTHTARKYC